MAGSRSGGYRHAFRVDAELVGGCPRDAPSAKTGGGGARGFRRELEYTRGCARARRGRPACPVVQSDDATASGPARAADSGRARGGMAGSGSAPSARAEESSVSVADDGGKLAEGEQPKPGTI